MNSADEKKKLTALVESAFPKKCNTCGKLYKTAEQFLTDTHSMPNGRSSLKEAFEEDGEVIVEVFRNCSCGSTLMDEFNSRRDYSLEGKKRRDEFNRQMRILEEQQIPKKIARAKVLKQFKVKKSDCTL